MRIAHVTDGYLPRLGGIERQVHGLALAQKQRGHEVEVITTVADRSGLELGFPVHRPRGRVAEHPGRIDYFAAGQGRDRVLSGDFDVVHVHASTFSPLAYLTARATNGTLPTALTLHSLWSYATPAFAGANAMFGWRRWPIAWSAVSSVAAGQLTAALKGADVSVLPNGVSPSLWTRPTTPSRPNTVTMVSTMRLCARKRPVPLLAIAHELRQRLPADVRLELKVIGEGPQMARMRDYLRHHRMTDWVQLLGRLDQPQIRHQYAAADIYVSPAHLESFGIAALEARCAGLPVVAFSHSGTADFIRPGREGLLADDDAGMVSCLERLITEPQLRQKISRRNAQSHPDQTWDEVSRTADELYGRAFDLIGRRLSPRRLIALP